MARRLDSRQDRRLRNFVEDDAICGLGVQLQDFRKVPTDGFSLAVFIGSQPYGLGLLGCGPQVGYNFLLVVGYFILRLKRF